MNTRRGFISLLGLGAAGLALDPEKSLWVPGKRLISIPRPLPVRVPGTFKIGDTIFMRKPLRFVSSSGLAWTPEPFAPPVERYTIQTEEEALRITDDWSANWRAIRTQSVAQLPFTP